MDEKLNQTDKVEALLHEVIAIERNIARVRRELESLLPDAPKVVDQSSEVIHPITSKPFNGREAAN